MARAVAESRRKRAYVPRTPPKPDTLKARFKLRLGQAFLPKSAREEMRRMILLGINTDEVGKAIAKRWKAGEWEAEALEGEFAHVEKFTREDWAAVAQKVRRAIPVHEYNAALGKGYAVPPHIVAAVKEDELLIRRTRKATVAAAAEAELKAARMLAEAQLAENLGERGTTEEQDAKARLDALRRAIMSKLSVEEEAEIMVSLVRGDNTQVARAMLDQIRDIMGVKAANVPEAPGLGPIFALPEGLMPGVR